MKKLFIIISLITSSYMFVIGQIKDGDGNTYTSVVIGTQTWLKENLKTTKFNDGTIIPLVKDNAEWAALTTPGYCWYDNDSNFKTPYGALYNWYTVGKASNGNKNVCPVSWHVPTDAEFMTLANYLGGIGVAGSKMQETGTAHWYAANAVYATNSSGFTAVGAGYRSSTVGFQFPVGMWGYTAYWNMDQKNVYIQTDAGLHFDSHLLTYGFSIRCLKDLSSDIMEPNTSNSGYLYPNPCDGTFAIKYNNPESKLLQISIADLTGKTVFENTSTEDIFNYNEQRLQSGIYVVTVKGENIYNVNKIIVK